MSDDIEALTQLKIDSGDTGCASPFCNNNRGKGRFCSSKCRLDGWAIRRAAQLLDKVGAIEFFEIMSRPENYRQIGNCGALRLTNSTNSAGGIGGA